MGELLVWMCEQTSLNAVSKDLMGSVGKFLKETPSEHSPPQHEMKCSSTYRAVLADSEKKCLWGEKFKHDNIL